MQALLSVSFGTSHADTRAKTIDAIEAELAAAFSDRAFYTAWTSPRIIAKVADERGEHHDSLEEAFARMAEDGVDDVIVATMCLMRGHEMAKVARIASAWAADGERTVRMAEPLLSGEGDIAALADVVAAELAFVPAGSAIVLMGHGSPNGPNEIYGKIQECFDAIEAGRFYVATVAGEPAFADVLPRVVASGAKSVCLVPLMVVAGDHAKTDMAGARDDSWASQLAACGIMVEVVLRGLGEYAGVRQMACDHAREARPLEASPTGK